MDDKELNSTIEGTMIRLEAFCFSLAEVAGRGGQVSLVTINLLRRLEADACSATGDIVALPELGDQPLLDDLIVRAAVLLASLDTKRYREWKTRRDVLRTPVADLELSSRCRRALRELNVQTVGNLLTYTVPELRKIKNFGETSLREISESLRMASGFNLRENMSE